VKQAQKNKTTGLPIGRALLIILAILGSMAALLFIPWNISDLGPHSNPAQNYTEAVQRIQALQTHGAAKMNPDCITQFMTHGQKTDKVIIFVHGYTNCPAQFKELGQRFYDLGYNVLIAPLPHQGLADRMTAEQGQLSAAELAAYANQVVDIADGLGKQVTMVGISAGGVTTAWAAQNRKDVEQAVLISPAFGFRAIPTAITAPTMNIVAFLPDTFVWWDEALKENELPLHTYPRYSKHALAQILRLGFAVQHEAGQQASAAARILVITNANDPSVNNDLTAKVVSMWNRAGAAVQTYEFPASLGYAHDLIDPSEPYQAIDAIYPLLIDLITK
jgi:alpha-beta hydrolase superfamily lysophospholipase